MRRVALPLHPLYHASEEGEERCLARSDQYSGAPARARPIEDTEPRGLEKVRLVVAAGSNEWVGTKIWPGSWSRGEGGDLYCALPPFSNFFIAVLSRYQIHALHLDARSFVLLSAFAFLCEAFVGVTPSVTLLCNFFSLELISEGQCSGCVSLKAAEALALRSLDVVFQPEAEGFRQKWVLVGVAKAGALFQPPLIPATPNHGWARGELGDSRFALVLARLDKLKRGVMMAMVVRGFVCRRITPIQCHSRPIWAFSGPRDPMRIQVLPHPPDVLLELLRRLTGGEPDKLPRSGLPLYKLKVPGALVIEMSLFDEWGFLPEKGARPRLPPTLGVRAAASSSRVAPSAVRASDVLLPTSLAPALERAGACGGDQSVLEVAIHTSGLRQQDTRSLLQTPNANQKRRLPGDDRLPAHRAPAKRRWVAMDE
ncbi:hypothetical protein D1007_07230 [Hordeum vulgare]|nr:hypothetical protein D1007_07230 [Hordeum vulgare]